jgi:DNA-binding NarL/FixJ family response regulator
MKIGIADPQARVRFGLRILLEQQTGWIVCGEASDDQELQALARDHRPDLLLIDWDLPGEPPVCLLHLLQVQFPEIIRITMSGRQELRHDALQAGADGFVCKTEPPEKLLATIREFQLRFSTTS